MVTKHNGRPKIKLITCIDTQGANSKIRLGETYEMLRENTTRGTVDIMIRGKEERGFYAWRFDIPRIDVQKLKDFK